MSRSRTYRGPVVLRLAFVCICAYALCSGVHAQTDQLAAALVARARTTGGVACVLGSSSGDLAVEMARQSSLVVAALYATQTEVDAARTDADDAFMLGRRVYADVGTAQDIPFADNYVDLLVIVGATDDGLASLPQSEILRVLTPFSGVAVIGNAGSGLTQGALQTWVDGFGVPQSGVASDAHGLWATIRRPALPGSDDWTHRFHGSDNNPLSTDTAYSYPHVTQWKGKPYHDVGAKAEFHVANGRLVVMSKDPGAWNNQIKQNLFYARNFYNGEVLWRRDLPFKYLTGNGAMVLSGDSLLMCLGKGIGVLDAANGGELGRIALDNVQGCAKWIGLTDGVAVVLAGGSDCSLDFPDPQTITSKMIQDSCFYADKPVKKGTEIAAYDLATGTTLWRHVEAQPIDIRFIAAHNGAVYFLSHGSRAAALDLRTGTQTWQNTDAGMLTDAAMDSTFFGGLFTSQRGVTVTPQMVIFGMEYSENFLGLSASTGSHVWTRIRTMVDRSPVASLVLDGEFWTRRRIIDVATGDSLRHENPPLNGCGTMTGGPDMIFGQCGVSMNHQSGERYGSVNGLHKSPCEVGSFIANGLYLNPPYGCTCGMVSRGFKVMAPAGSMTFNDSVGAGRLTTGAGDISTVQPLAVDATDWPTYRHDNQRTAGASVSTQSSPHIMWTYTPHTPNSQDFEDPFGTRTVVDHHPTQPTAAGGYFFVGNTDGTVSCVDASDGIVEWTFATGGAVIVSPSVADGRVYAGSLDGNVYALEATTGRLLWRFRAAPYERRIMLFGHLSSTWPVVTGVLVDNGVAYFGAGHNAEDGTHVYAVNAVTGALVWQNNDLGHSATLAYGGRNLCGTMAIARGRLWLRSANIATTALDLTDGTLLPGPCDPENWGNKRQGRQGSEIAVFNNAFILHGGQRQFSDHMEYKGTENKLARWANMSFFEMDTDGSPLYPEVQPFVGQHALHPPAWDGDVVVVAQTDHSDVYGWSTPQTASYLTSTREANPGVSSEWWQESTVKDETPDAHPMKLWGPLSIRVNASVVAANEIVMAYTEDNALWKVGGFDKQAGTTNWSVDLPMEPVFSGTIVNRDGAILVALRDGRVLGVGSGPVSIAGATIPPVTPAVQDAASDTRTAGWTPNPQPQHRVAGSAAATDRTEEPVVAGESGHRSVLNVMPDNEADVRDLQPWQLSEASPGRNEVRVLEPALSTPAPMPPYTHQNMHWDGPQGALKVAEVRSSAANAPHVASNTIDSDLRTRWSPTGGEAPWLVYDLGRKRLVDGVSLVWYSPNGEPFDLHIETSPSGSDYATADVIRLRGRGTHTSLLSFLPCEARFVRVRPGEGHAAPSLYEVAVLGCDDDDREALR